MHKGARRHGRLSRGSPFFLKATLPTCVPRRRGLSLLQHAPRSSPYGAGAGSHTSCKAVPGQKKPNRRAQCMQPPSGYKQFSTFAQTSGRKGGQPCRRHATTPSGRTSPTSNVPSMEAHAHASCNRRAGRYVQATAPPLAPLPRLLDCGTSTMTRGNPAYDPAVPARRDGQCGQKWAGSDGGGRRAGAAVTSSAKLMSHPGAVREPSLTA
jgi:hypothetical protein